MTLTLELADAEATEALGARLAPLLPATAVVYLRGDLGTGKTTLVRGLLMALGHQGPVKSPTYTLIEPYRLAGRAIAHCDLYRLVDPEELEYLGLRDGLGETLLLIEWPERGAGWLPEADLIIELGYQADRRKARVTAYSPELITRLVLLHENNS